MGLFKKIFNKDETPEIPQKKHKGFYQLTVSDVDKITPETVKVTFQIPEHLKDVFRFSPGQFVNVILPINKLEERRSYSICSANGEDLAIAVKVVDKGIVSIFLNEQLNVGDQIQVSHPEGNFKLDANAKKIVSYAAGSGITPIFSMVQEIEKNGSTMHLFYGNKTKESIIFHDELESFKNTRTIHYLSQEQKNGYFEGRLDKHHVSEEIKKNLDLLKADAFYICGPEAMIMGIQEVLQLFGVPKEKIHFELYTTPVLMKDEKANATIDFDGNSQVTVILDDEKIAFKLDSVGKTILDTVNDLGYDAPYSCRGGVCCSCRAKVLEGKATMNLNYSLTDQEVADGYILTCQAHPASEKLVLSYDE